jgi:hypothetical protein
MKNPFRRSNLITRQSVPAADQLTITKNMFGVPFQLEVIARGFVMTMATDYRRSSWQFYVLSNGGSYTAPQSDQSYHLIGEKYPLSADAMGLVSSLLALNYLSFSIGLDFADRCDAAYSLLREFIHQHPESTAIFDATS